MARICAISKFGPNQTFNWYRHAYEDLGHEFLAIEENTVDSVVDTVEQIREFNPDFVVWSKLNVPCSKLNLITALNKEFFTVCQTVDLFYNVTAWIGHRDPDDVMFRAKLVITTGGRYEGEVIRQGIHKPEYYSVDANKTIDVAFVGLKHCQYRADLFKVLENKYNFVHIGEEVQIRGPELNDFYGTVKVVVGDSIPFASHWSNRIYETTGRGGFIIHPEIPGLEDEFVYGKEIVTYKYGNIPQLLDKIDYYLAHDEEREKIKRAGHKRCGEYTYHARAQQVLDVVEKYR